MTNRHRPTHALIALLAALAFTIFSATSASAQTRPGPETRVRALDTLTANAVRHESTKTPASIGALRPEQSAIVLGACVATEAGTLSPVAARDAYLAGERGIAAQADGLAAQGVSAEQRARTLFDARNALRTNARGLMADRELAQALAANEPNMTWTEIVAKYQGRGFSGNELWNEIARAASRSRSSVNEMFGLDP